jgi:hypothetical protein
VVFGIVWDYEHLSFSGYSVPVSLRGVCSRATKIDVALGHWSLCDLVTTWQYTVLTHATRAEAPCLRADIWESSWYPARLARLANWGWWRSYASTIQGRTEAMCELVTTWQYTVFTHATRAEAPLIGMLLCMLAALPCMIGMLLCMFWSPKPGAQSPESGVF